MPDGEWRSVVDRAEITRLGEGSGGGSARAGQPIERTADAIATMVDEAGRR